MHRRDFVAKALPGLAATGLLAGCSRPAETLSAEGLPRVSWRMTSSFTRSLDILYGAVEYFAQRVSGLTGGRFTIRTYPAGELVPGLQVLDAVQQGTVQIGQSASYYYTGKHDAFAFDTCVPFGLTTRQQLAWLYQAGGLDLLRDIFSDFNIINFPAGSTGAQMGGWFRRDIHSLADLNGLKMRIPGIGGEVMSRLNVTVQVLSGADVYMALERGAIDAVEWVGPYDDEKLGFHNIVKNYYYPGWWEPGATLSHYVNKTAWNRLPEPYQAAIEIASADTCLWMTSAYDTRNPQALKRLINHGVNLRRFPEDSLIQAEKLSFEVMEEKAARNPAYAKIYHHWKAFRADVFPWFDIAENSYQSFAFPRV
ncbi:MAG TPA: TRAP transporter substrate-binding protein [Kiritimatiellia bacterium]|nr:TRAP transporter substrate-binding protein [Kiritimatiellia bacterium]